MHQEYEPCLARVRILVEFLTQAHLESGWPAQKSTISLPFPKGWPQHCPTSQPAAPIMLWLPTPHSGLRDVVTPRYTTTPHQWHNSPPCPSPPSPGWYNPGSAHISLLKFKTRCCVCVCMCVRVCVCVWCVCWFIGGQSQVWPLFLFTLSLSSWLLRMEELGGGTYGRGCQVQPTQHIPFGSRGWVAGATSALMWWHGETGLLVETQLSAMRTKEDRSRRERPGEPAWAFRNVSTPSPIQRHFWVLTMCHGPS